MQEASYKAPALGMGLKLIETLSKAKAPLSLSEIARLVGTNKNMATRLLATLQAEGWAESLEPGPRYRLTLKPFAIVSESAGKTPLVELARGPLTALWEDCAESCYLAAPRQGKALYLLHLDAEGPVRIAGRVGGEYPLYCTAPGKALLAHMGEAEFKRAVASGLQSMTPATLTDPAKLAADLAKVRERGYAIDAEEFGRGIICVAAPVFGHDRALAGAVGISSTFLTHSLEDFVAVCAPKVVAAAAEISKKLGFES